MTRPTKKIWNGNVRDAALSILMEINNNQAYSNLLLHRTNKEIQYRNKRSCAINRTNLWNPSTPNDP